MCQMYENKKSTPKTTNNGDFINGVTVAVMQKQCAYLEKVDNLRQVNSLCDECFVKQDRMCKVTDYMLKKLENEKIVLSPEKN